MSASPHPLQSLCSSKSHFGKPDPEAPGIPLSIPEVVDAFVVGGVHGCGPCARPPLRPHESNATTPSSPPTLSHADATRARSHKG